MAGSVFEPPGTLFEDADARARQAGKLYVMPPTGSGPAFTDYMNRTFLLFKHSFGGYFGSRDEYVPFVKDLANEGLVWAVLGIDEQNNAQHKLSYTLAMNGTAQPEADDDRLAILTRYLHLVLAAL